MQTDAHKEEKILYCASAEQTQPIIQDAQGSETEQVADNTVNPQDQTV